MSCPGRRTAPPDELPRKTNLPGPNIAMAATVHKTHLAWGYAVIGWRLRRFRNHVIGRRHQSNQGTKGRCNSRDLDLRPCC